MGLTGAPPVSNRRRGVWICFKRRRINLSTEFAGQSAGVTQVGERAWLATFVHNDLGYFADETCRLEPIDYPFTPFGPKTVLPMCSV